MKKFNVEKSEVQTKNSVNEFDSRNRMSKKNGLRQEKKIQLT